MRDGACEDNSSFFSARFLCCYVHTIQFVASCEALLAFLLALCLLMRIFRIVNTAKLKRLYSRPTWLLCSTIVRNPIKLIYDNQWCIAKNGGGYTQTGVAKGLKVPCLFMITEVSIRCPKNPEVGIRRIPASQYTTDDNWQNILHVQRVLFIFCHEQAHLWQTDFIISNLFRTMAAQNTITT